MGAVDGSCNTCSINVSLANADATTAAWAFVQNLKESDIAIRFTVRQRANPYH